MSEYPPGVYVARTACSRCLFTADRVVPGSRAAQIISDCRATDSFFVCHRFSIHGGPYDVEAREVQTKYGAAWRIDAWDMWANFNYGKTPRKIAARGGKVVEVTEVGPAKAIIAGSGKGLSGAASCYVRTIRTDRPAREGWRHTAY